MAWPSQNQAQQLLNSSILSQGICPLNKRRGLKKPLGFQVFSMYLQIKYQVPKGLGYNTHPKQIIPYKKKKHYFVMLCLI